MSYPGLIQICESGEQLVSWYLSIKQQTAQIIRCQRSVFFCFWSKNSKEMTKLTLLLFAVFLFQVSGTDIFASFFLEIRSTANVSALYFRTYFRRPKIEFYGSLKRFSINRSSHCFWPDIIVFSLLNESVKYPIIIIVSSAHLTKNNEHVKQEKTFYLLFRIVCIIVTSQSDIFRFEIAFNKYFRVNHESLSWTKYNTVHDG